MANENGYFSWLYTKVVRVDNVTPSNSFDGLLRCLHSTPFEWVVSGDDNRAEEGVETRKDYYKQTHETLDSFTMTEPCSVLEMLIAFTKRCEFDTDISAKEWFWIILENLGLARYTNSEMRYPDSEYTVREILHRLVYRQYRRNGQNGGMFPLNNSVDDLRDVEIYYQFCQWLIDQGM